MIERTRSRFVVLNMHSVKARTLFSLRQFLRRTLLVALALTLPVESSRGAETDVRRDATVEAVERVMPSVVNIGTEEIVEYSDAFEQMFREFWDPYYRSRPPEARYNLGSGVIIDETGYVLTCLHVVQRASRAWVKLADGREFEAERIVGTTRSDVALLKLMAKPGEKFKAVKFARNDDLLLGETVIALGNPFGLGGSISRGILSSKNRRAPKEEEPLDVADWLQIDAPINFGNSGGPLINLKGELIGLNVAVYRQGQGIGFAVPVKQVTEALSEIFIPEVTKSLWFGARVRSGPYPLTVTAVEAGSPAGTAGLKVGDQVVQINGRAPKDFIQFTEWLSDSPERETTLVVARDGEERRTATARMIPLVELIRRKLGVSVQELTPELAGKFGYRPRSGLLVEKVDGDGPAARADLQPGYLIALIDGQSTPDLFSAASAVASKKQGERADLTVQARQQRGAFARMSQGSVTVRVR